MFEIEENTSDNSDYLTYKILGNIVFIIIFV